MKVLISMRITAEVSYNETRDSISHDWMEFAKEFNFVPILIPNSAEIVKEYFDLGACGLILTGGESFQNDIKYSARDETEIDLIKSAIKKGLPIFGVCRGLQVLNSFFGGDCVKIPHRSHVGQHNLNIVSGQSIRINSFHEEGITETGLADDLVPFAFSDDGFVEGVRHRTLPIIAVQWHPERAGPSWLFNKQLFEDWKKKCV
jgi:gamma-glutamyl-gamma-aminobutyrate hydrolase PuuD